MNGTNVVLSLSPYLIFYLIILESHRLGSNFWKNVTSLYISHNSYQNPSIMPWNWNLFNELILLRNEIKISIRRSNLWILSSWSFKSLSGNWVYGKLIVHDRWLVLPIPFLPSNPGNFGSKCQQLSTSCLLGQPKELTVSWEWEKPSTLSVQEPTISSKTITRSQVDCWNARWMNTEFSLSGLPGTLCQASLAWGNGSFQLQWGWCSSVRIKDIPGCFFRTLCNQKFQAFCCLCFWGEVSLPVVIKQDWNWQWRQHGNKRKKQETLIPHQGGKGRS